MQTMNPIFKATEKTITYEQTATASHKGVAWKSTFLFGLVILSALLTAFLGFKFNNTNPEVPTPGLNVKPWLLVSVSVASIIGIISILIGSLAPKSAIFFGPIYSLCQGVIVGFITTIVGFYMPGVAILSGSATLIIFLVCLLINMFASVRMKTKIAKFFMAITIALFVFMILSLIMRLAAPNFFKSLGESNPTLYFAISIGVSVFLILYGAFMLLNDFMYVDYLVESGADKRYEWSAALGIIFSLIWIYIELIRFFILIASLFKR